MNRKLEIALVVFLTALAASVFFLPVAADGAYPLRDIEGVLHGSLTKAETNLTVLLFLSSSCPISAQYTPQIIRICDDYRGQGAGCFLVFPEAGLTPAGLKDYLRAYGHNSPAILDSAHALVKKTGATITPEAAVFSRSGSLLYRGRIDDRYADLGRRRSQAGQQDLRDAIEMLASGKPAKAARTEAVGCFIEDLPSE